MAILYALKALHELDLLKDTTIRVAFTGDEERTGKPLSISRKPLIDAAKKSDIALGFETATGFNYATIAHEVPLAGKSKPLKESTFLWRIQRAYRSWSHFEMSRILHEFYEEVRGETYLTFNPGTLFGGTFVDYDPLKSSGTAYGKTNVVAQKALVNGGLRFISEEQKERARAKMRTIVDAHLPSTNATITFTDGYLAMFPTESKEILGALSQVSQDLGFGEVNAYDPGRRGAADIFVCGQPCTGPRRIGKYGDGAHTPNETVNLKTFNAHSTHCGVYLPFNPLIFYFFQ